METPTWCFNQHQLWLSPGPSHADRHGRGLLADEWLGFYGAGLCQGYGNRAVPVRWPRSGRSTSLGPWRIYSTLELIGKIVISHELGAFLDTPKYVDVYQYWDTKFERFTPKNGFNQQKAWV